MIQFFILNMLAQQLQTQLRKRNSAATNTTILLWVQIMNTKKS
jgi:hypothetical protein